MGRLGRVLDLFFPSFPTAKVNGDHLDLTEIRQWSLVQPVSIIWRLTLTCSLAPAKIGTLKSMEFVAR